MFVIFAFAVSACDATTTVDVIVEEDGSGIVEVQVELDQAAASGLLDLNGETGLWLEDVSEAGWEIVPPTVGEDRNTTIGASKRFGTPAQLNEIMQEITGSAGVFSDFSLVRTKEFARVRYQLSGSVEPSGIEALADTPLVASLGRPLTELLDIYGGASATFPIEIRVYLPGHIDETAVTGGSILASEDKFARTWKTSFTASEQVPVQIGSTTTGVAALVWRGVAVIAALLALLVALGNLLRVLRPAGRRKRTSAKKTGPTAQGRRSSDKVLAATAADSAEAEAEEADRVAAGPTVVALDGMGVLYREGSDISEILIPFAREMGSTVSDDSILSKSRQMSLGRLAPIELWSAIGIEGDSNEIDDLYLSRHQLNPGVVNFLRELRGRGIRVACITNDSSAWANKLMARHSLEGLIDPWIVSGAVGVRKPDAPIFEVLRRVTGEPPASILVVDDELENLDAARDLGFRTAWFAPAGDAAGARGHSILRSFSLEAEEDAV